MRSELLDAGTFETYPGRGMQGGDLECNDSLVAGKCALGSISWAAVTCGIWPDCDTVVYYASGQSHAEQTGWIAVALCNACAAQPGVRLLRRGVPATHPTLTSPPL